MSTRRSTHLYSLAAVGGALLWIVTAAATGLSEAWDSPLYWRITYPLSILLAAALGFVEPERAWRWGFVVIMVQLLVTMFTSGNSWNLLPIGVVFTLVLSVPAVVAAVVAAKLRRWMDA